MRAKPNRARVDWKMLIHQGWAGIYNGKLVDRRHVRNSEAVLPEFNRTEKAQLLQAVEKLEVENTDLRIEIRSLKHSKNGLWGVNEKLRDELEKLRETILFSKVAQRSFKRKILEEVCKTLKYL